MKIICTLQETSQFLAEELAKYDNVSSKKRLVTKWIKQSETYLADMTNAVNNCKGWFLGDVYHYRDILRERTNLSYLKFIYKTL